MKYLKQFREKFREFPIFTIKDAKLVLKKMGATGGYVQTMIHNLLSKGEIKKITRGVYTFHDDMVFIGFAFYPFYYGLQDALSWRNIWEQEVNPIVITPKKVRTGVREFLGRNYIIRRIERKMFFGMDSIKQDKFWIPVSDPEKTLIDFVYYKEKIPKTALKELVSIIRKDVLRQYLKKVPKWVKKRVENLISTHHS